MVRAVKINYKFAVEELKILRRIVDITCSDLDLAGILHEVVLIVNEMTKADSIFVYLSTAAKSNPF